MHGWKNMEILFKIYNPSLYLDLFLRMQSFFLPPSIFSNVAKIMIINNNI
jgi:hypothetical protein